MPLSIRDETVTRRVRELAALNGSTLTEAVRVAVEHELERRSAEAPLRERLLALARSLPRRPEKGRPVDKAFYDELSGDL